MSEDYTRDAAEATGRRRRIGAGDPTGTRSHGT